MSIPRSIKLRLAVIVMMILAAGLVLAPTFWPSSRISELHDLRVTLPIEFTGGTELTLVVEVDQAIAEVRNDHVRYCREVAESRGLDVDSFSATGTGEIEVTSPEPAALLEAFLNQHVVGPYHLVASKDGRHTFALSRARRDEISRASVANTIQILSDRLCGRATVEQIGDTTLFVRLPPDWDDELCL